MHPLITKILWAVMGLNVIALVVVAIAFFASTAGRNVDTMESGWMAILFIAGVVVIALGAAFLHFGKSNFSLIMSGFFAFLPLGILLSILASNYLPSFKRNLSMAEFYYQDKSQRKIAEAIENGDVAAVKQLIQGQELNITGTPHKDGDSLNYLQFAIRLRSTPTEKFQEEPNLAIIKMLIAAGSNPTLALPEGIRRLPQDVIRLLLDAGADPNTHGFVKSGPLLFEAIGQTKTENDIAILLVQKGARCNVRNAEGNTPLMFAALNAGTSERWQDTWRLIRYLIEKANADYTFKRPDGVSFSSITQSIHKKAIEEKVIMPADFYAVLKIIENDPEQRISRNTL
ncbi:ankyrin repeat domain-containing protein [Dyadobacter luticola]|uniref:Uncharacterized protein n=1 Tax=Dyadobacter luticola TaxID=1979387 RepID=A0A5R9KYT4_9BACT|nr:hypothetical protein [Dyadobacter luticola]TLV01472.1 hypothetical protein FEN17_18775 [Dyadobacter luticola]